MRSTHLLRDEEQADFLRKSAPLVVAKIALEHRARLLAAETYLFAVEKLRKSEDFAVCVVPLQHHELVVKFLTQIETAEQARLILKSDRDDFEWVQCAKALAHFLTFVLPVLILGHLSLDDLSWVTCTGSPVPRLFFLPFSSAFSVTVRLAI